jgi:hypothetical protein
MAVLSGVIMANATEIMDLQLYAQLFKNGGLKVKFTE